MAAHVLPADSPANDAQLFDRLHALFGFGDWTAQPPVDSDGELAAGGVPWWKFRGIETAKIKAMRRKRGLSLAELHVAALYCRAHDITVPGPGWLSTHVRDAWVWWDERVVAGVDAGGEADWEAAVHQEVGNPDPTWRDQLLRASPEMRAEVAAAWAARNYVGDV